MEFPFETEVTTADSRPRMPTRSRAPTPVRNSVEQGFGLELPTNFRMTRRSTLPAKANERNPT